MTFRVLEGDCLAVMPTLDVDSIDAIVTDPPYGLSFMGKAWDRGVPGVPFWVEALRVAKPGAHLCAFGGSRTFHRLTVAIEDAGWEIRDTLMWLYGSGFPKSLDVSKAIGKAAGCERAVVGHGRAGCSGLGVMNDDGWQPRTGPMPITAAATDAARQWQGWGTALKPAWEPIILARKPFKGTVAANVQEHGTGALNIDACRIETEGGSPSVARRDAFRKSGLSEPRKGGVAYGSPGPAAAEEFARERPGEFMGRWPANLVLDEDAARLLDEQTGQLTAGVAVRHRAGGKTFGGDNIKPPMDDMGYGDSGGASRFFYTAKASRSEREEGLDGGLVDAASRHHFVGLPDPRMDREQIRKPSRNHHPTVKPLALMQWLCKLVTPPGGTVLDPFCGSGSTGRAAVAEGFCFIGIELSPEYAAIARARIGTYAPLFAEGSA